jgi:putative flippase GtrA
MTLESRSHLLEPRFLRYLAVGVGTFTLYTWINLVATMLVGVHPPVATGAALLAAGAFNYLAHRAFAFHSRRSTAASLPRYMILMVVNALLGSLIIAGLTRLGLSIVAANAVCLAIVTGSTYVIMARMVM